MKTKLLIALIAFTTVFTACKKDDDDTPDGGGTDTGDYQPVTAGSTWQYHSESSGTYTETALGTDTTIEGEKYYKFDNTANGRRYISKSNGVYKQYGYVQELQKSVNLKYLVDGAVGTNWTEEETISQGPISVPVKAKFNIASRDGSKVVNGHTYNSVIAVDIAITANVLGTELPVATAHQFYAKGVGAISSSLNLDFQGETAMDSTYLVEPPVIK
ncbi:MAG TPA: hypothetical protein VM871_01270 [Flavisolibacter sp.]|nr:hypothetical protein [Flavisolibacter sp.]